MAVVGSEVYLRRDYDNLVDRNAVFVTFESLPIGYVPRNYAQLMAPDLDAGRVGKGEVTSNELSGVPLVRVRIDA